jgi:O-methyltransferase/8-demethyl-8-(2,3-dimethoxy-alpha-L-rhamnosyl)tetracenomycin-C 4'-O-methyltransferase
MTRPAVTIVIPVWNAAQTTSNCLSVLRRTLGPDDQVVVVDNGSRDATPQVLARHDWIEVVTHEENQGFAGGCNAGARRARNPIVIFLNNDTVPAPGWIEGLVAPFADPEVGATGPVSNMASGYQYLGDAAYQPKTVDEIVRYSDEVRRQAAGRRREVDLLIGFCVAVRTSVFTEIGGFDESFGIGGCEDNDLSNRLRFAGWRLVVVQDTFVHHIGHQTFDANQLDWLAIEGSNETRLQEKMDSGFPVSFVVLCGAEPVPLITTLVGIQEAMGAAEYEVVLLVPDRAPLSEVLDGVSGVTVVDVPGLPEDRAWQLGHHKATGLRRAMLRAGEAVDVGALQRLVDTDPLQAWPTAVGTAIEPQQPVADGEQVEAAPWVEAAPVGGDLPPLGAPAAGDGVALYLDLMQKCLTNTVYEDPAQDPWSGGKFDPDKRAAGQDWPSVAHTMIGQQRMTNLRQVVESVLADRIPGDLIETGVWRGGACIFMRAILKAYGVTDRRVFVADSFEGLPPPNPDLYPADAGDQHYTFEPLAVSLEQVQANFAKYDLLDHQVVFLKGWFKDTLPTAPVDRLSVLRLDGDMYESTMDALVALYDKVSPGGYIIVDDFVMAGCNKAILDFRAQRGIVEPIVGIDRMSAYWRKATATV